MAQASPAPPPSSSSFPPELESLLNALEPARRAVVTQRLEDWLSSAEEGKKISQTLTESGASDSAAVVARLQPLYLAVFAWISQLLEKRGKASGQEGNEAGPLLVALSAPQGSGSKALADALKFLFAAEGSETLAISLDSFYALAGKQEKLAQKHSENPLVQYPGNPGTHEPLLAACVLESLKRNSPNGEVLMPVYDKSLNGGKGDRLCVKDWQKIKTGNIKLIIFEGWMLGFKAAAEANEEAFPSLTKEEVEWMKPINKSLKEYEALHALVDAWIVFQADALDRLFDWRCEEEKAHKQVSGEGKTAEEVRASVEKFLPTYKAYLPRMSARGPDGATGETPVLEVFLDAARDAAKASVKLA
ncbi:Kinase-like protein, related [Neospora caninum Liverpool]|uniref:Kinase-like protein, related n=1 Tax=Neospora caninum (strain Liverpool) TaxID=572307 RepID=F0VEE1_NEOCL|nr:Kinase-like protein, related [Neospora caninum Liverpool]CBZ52085.1 Kinase-like protein, related [Neospora caninum Liverpool]CEL66047.1 TPA: Kinase-like protein, related [Neospora caninum Liverpool]|eukprot:XP_003882117.1 Kinase-like protein, related [Neospora caninum Liverpool]